MPTRYRIAQPHPARSTMTRPPDQADAQLVAEVLLAGADQRQRTATKAAAVVEETRLSGRDARSSAVRVTRVLAEAGRLESLAAALKDGTVALVATATVAADALAALAAATQHAAERDGLTLTERVASLEADLTRAPAEDVTDPEDVTADTPDGLSAAAHEAAELAGLEPTVIDDTEDPLTGATAEDEPDDVAEVLT